MLAGGLAVSCAGTGTAPIPTRHGPAPPPAAAAPLPPLPWREAGLTERQAAAHLLDRFAYGARPSDVDRVVGMGLERWLGRQIAASFPEPELGARLRPLSALALSEVEISATYPNPGTVLAEARVANVIPKDYRRDAMDDATRRDIRQKALDFARRRGYRPQRELVDQLLAQKLLRAIYAENQLAEVLTDFWFNHFNVSLSKGQCRVHLLSYERDAIRPHVLGRFRDLLGATATHPAMLLYLDNASSTASEGAPTTASLLRRPRARGLGPAPPPKQAGANGQRGPNENYARELMELHTMGVDGGYTQRDVVEVARAFTGWTVMPAGPARAKTQELLARAAQAGERGFVEEGEFLFRADTHDAGAKVILGRRFPAGRGMEDGEEVLDFLAASPATAMHLARLLAVRFVSDDPPKSLVERLSLAYLHSKGDLSVVMRTLATAPEFWSAAAMRNKVKSPFELAASALRALDADVSQARGVLAWVGRMGEPLYTYQAPTGYPDRAEAWVNAGSLLNRMNFGLELAAAHLGGVRFDLLALNHNREPESVEAALAIYVALLLPGRDPSETIRLLTPVVHDPAVATRVAAAAPQQTDAAWASSEENELFGETTPTPQQPVPASPRPGNQLPYVVGVILGSPEFQRR
jgi:uncharacterized protein (DUF1800 family)